METEDHWVRIHVVPRTTYFYPADGPEGPVLHQIKPVRVTQLCYLDGTKETREHAWDDKHWGKAKTKARWTGRSVFVKIKAEEDTGEMPTQGTPLRPGSVESIQATLSTLRTELAEAQRRDPRLLEIINTLQKQERGSYLAEPRGPEGQRSKSRAQDDE